jgi:hypothetical protein
MTSKPYRTATIQYRITSKPYRTTTKQYRTATIQYCITTIQYRMTTIPYCITTKPYRITSIQYRITTKPYCMTTISYRTLEYIGSAKKNKYCSNNKTVLAMFRVMSAGENSEKDKIVCVNGTVLPKTECSICTLKLAA